MGANQSEKAITCVGKALRSLSSLSSLSLVVASSLSSADTPGLSNGGTEASAGQQIHRLCGWPGFQNTIDYGVERKIGSASTTPIKSFLAFCRWQ